MASQEEDFPRGGTSKKPTGSKPVIQKTDVDNLFQVHTVDVKKKRKSTRDAQTDLKKQRTSRHELKLNAPLTVDILRLHNLKVGTLLLGCVKEVNDFQVIIGLPGDLRGFLPVSNVCDVYTKMLNEQLQMGDIVEEVLSLPSLFAPGKLLRCVVSSLETTKKGNLSVKVSVNPKEVNKGFSAESLKAGMVLSGCVQSVEDHGYLVDIGVSGTKAFLPKGTDEQVTANQAELKLGQYVDCVLKEVKNEGRVVRLAVSTSAISPARAETQHGWTLRNLLPGLLVKAQIKTVTKRGLVLEFLSSFTGTVDFLHIDPEGGSSYTTGATVKACVLFVEPSTRYVGLSLREHLLRPSVMLQEKDSKLVGKVFEGCVVKSVQSSSGAVLELPDGFAAFVHKSDFGDSGGKPVKVTAKSSITCRLIGFSLLEQMHVASLRRSVIDKPFIRYNDIRPGQIVEGKVLSVSKSVGMVVQLTDYIRGLVPAIHLSDIVLKNPEKKFSVGTQVKCRVLTVNPDSKKLTLTAKKTLLRSRLPLICQFADAKVGQVSHGFVVHVEDYGCIICFYGGVKGLVPVRELSRETVFDPRKLFYIGQVVKAKVLSCDVNKEKILFSFKAVTDDISTESNSNGETGKEVEVRIEKKLPEGLEVSVLPEGDAAFLPTIHLSDHFSNCSLVWEALKEGDVISDAVALREDKAVLTKKALIKASVAQGALAREFCDLQVGMQLVGWIKDIMSFGVFVEFPYCLIGLAPNSAMSNKFITSPEESFWKGQTVAAKVTALDEEKHRFLVSLKASEVSFEEEEYRRRLLQGVQERKAVAEMTAARDDSDVLKYVCSLRAGQRLKLVVDKVKNDGSVTFVGDRLGGVNVTAALYHVTGVTLTPGQKVTAAVLCVHPCPLQVHVSLAPQLLGNKKQVGVGSTLSAKVQHVDQDFAIISLGDSSQLTVISTAAHLNEPWPSESEKLTVGRSLYVAVREPACEGLGGLPLVAWSRAASEALKSAWQVRSKMAEPRHPAQAYKPGDVVSGTVKSIRPLNVLVGLATGGTGTIHISQMGGGVGSKGRPPTSCLKMGSEVTGRVIGEVDISSHRCLAITNPESKYSLIQMTLRPSGKTNKDSGDIEPDKKLKSFSAGDKVTCFVSKYSEQDKCLEVTVTPWINGTVDHLLMTLDHKAAKYPKKMYKIGQALSAKVFGIDYPKKRLLLSLTGVCSVEVGTVTLGTVKEVLEHSGLIVSLPHGQSGYVSFTDLSDCFSPKPLENHWVGKIVRCCIVGEVDGNFQLSLRHSRTVPEMTHSVKDPEILSTDDLKAGQLVRGYVKHVGAQGVFIRLSRTVTGHVRFEHVSSPPVKDRTVYTKHIPVHALYTTKVLRVNKGGQVELSLLPEDTGKPNVLLPSSGSSLQQEEQKKNLVGRKRASEQTESKPPKPAKRQKKRKAVETEESDSGVDAYFQEEEEEEEGKKKKEVRAQKESQNPVGVALEGSDRLQVAGGFSWDMTLSSLRPVTATNRADSSDDEEARVQKSQKKSKKVQEMEKKQAEKALSQLESELMDPGVQPQSAGGFERLVLSSPNSSLVWLQYMAFHLQATEIEQARAVAERALKTISFREEQEKLNVWVALLNLENLYGTEDSLQKVFDRALQYCDPMAVYQRLADIYTKSSKHKEAEVLYKNMVKRFRQERAVWLSYGAFLLRRGQGDEAHSVLQRALKSLPLKEHVELIAKFAQLEFQCGDSERAKSMFDRTLASYPKRTDLWSMYLDLMIKHGSQKEVRDLFDRVIHLSVAVKRIKFFFKRYLEYEKRSGTPESVQAVKEKALQYVEARSSEAAS